MITRLFLACQLLWLPAAATAAPPTPTSHFGHAMGADRKLLDWDKVVSYFQTLAKSSDRLRFEEIGKTVEGRPFIAVTISSAATLKNLDHYLDIQKRLADPRRTSSTEAGKLFLEGKTVVMITCSVHATEVGATLTAIEFAYRLLTEDNPRYKAILDNVILILIPSQNPDGVDIVTKWYRQTLGTPWEGTDPPELYHHYVGHDNNRDWYIFSQPETRATVTLENLWHPQIVYDVHQQGSNASRIFLPPWLDPVDPNIDAILAQECNWIGTGVAVDLMAAGKKGVAINALYDFWTPARHYQAYHGGLRILSESASVRLATPVTVTAGEIDETALGYNPRERSWNYLEPWLGGEWHLRDIVDYQLIAFESLLYQAAVHRADMLRYFYEINRRAVERTAPYAFVIPSIQHDPGSAKKMLETLAFGAVEIERSQRAFSTAGREFPAGSYVIRMRQPYSSYAKTLLERQGYPDLRQFPGGPPKRPYDVTAQTLPLLMGVDVATIGQPFEAALRPVSQFDFELDHKIADGALAASDVFSWREVNRIWKAGGPVYRNSMTGDFFRAAGPGRKTVAQPKIGLYKGFVPQMDEGWTRWLLDEFGFAYSSPGNADLQAGNLRQRFDVIVIPDQPRTAIVQGYQPNSMPPQYTGGLGVRGAAALTQFVDQGGTLILLNQATEYALQDLGVGARNQVTNVVRDVEDRDYYSPGSLLNVTLKPGSPLSYGLPEQLTIWSEQSPAWEAPESQTVLRYPNAGVLASGWLLGSNLLTDKAALLDVPVGSGRMILFGLRPQYRAQSYQNFKLFFNALTARAE